MYAGRFIVGHGIAYSNGYQVQADLFNLIGEPLEPGWFDLKFMNDPKIAVMALSIQ